MANTDIKFFVHTNNNAPQLQNAFGSMINVLDACLIDGFFIGGLASVVASGKTVTATFIAPHNLMQYQVIKITGAAQSEFNGEHRVLTVPNSNTVTLELTEVPSVSTASGTITASLPPLGWEKPFSSTNENGGGKAAYRSLNTLLSSRPFLRIVDELDPVYTVTYAKYAKVGIVEDMTDIDTMLGVQAPYDAASPNKNWVGYGSGSTTYNGWAKWYYALPVSFGSIQSDATAPANGARKWILIGDADYFYILPVSTADTNDNINMCYGFGLFESYLPADFSNTFLFSTLVHKVVTASANSSVSVSANTPISTPIGRIILQRGYSQLNECVMNASCASIISSGNLVASGSSNVYAAQSLSGQVPQTPIFINDGSLRGKLPLVQWLFQTKPYAHQALINHGLEKYMAINIGSGQIVARIA